VAFDPDVMRLLGLAGSVPLETYVRERADGKLDVYVRGKLLGAFSYEELLQNRARVDATAGAERLTITASTP